VDAIHGRDGHARDRKREPIPFLIDAGMDESVLIGHEEIAAA
jgi:hypothetical protein